MKKIFSLLLTLTMVLSLAACGGNSSTPSTPSGDGTQLRCRPILIPLRSDMFPT